MEQFSQLGDKVSELVESMLSHNVVGDSTVGITQYSFFMFLCALILLVVMFAFVRKQRTSLVPQGRFVNAMELLVEFVESDMCKATVGPTWRKHFPFIATVFFFVLVNNVMGLLPGAHPGTGTMGVTVAVALVSFVYFIVQGMRAKGVLGYIKSLAPEGVAFPMNILVWCIEVFSTFLRLITLAVRLFCNMFSGHVVMGAFCILITLFCQPLAAGLSGAVLAGASTSVAWMLILLIVYGVEFLVAPIQAYVFALLTAVYVQLAEGEE